MAGTCITGTTKVLAVIGDPVKHSLSPLMHNAALAALGLDYVYLAFPIRGENLGTALAGFAAIDLVGFNITIPHKQAIMPLLQDITPLAQAVGAVNTVWRTDRGWAGTNTDVLGFLAPLRRLDRPWADLPAVVLGNGGAARAVVAGLLELGCPRIQVVGRDGQRLRQFQASWPEEFRGDRIHTHHWDDLPHLLPTAGLLVNTTPLGMAPQVDRTPLGPGDLDRLPPTALVYDLIYTPNPTQLLALAQERGLGAIDGLEMLVQQGAEALRLWTQAEVPVEIMGQTLRNHLGLA
ncbi:shikimate dehydrogenase [Prochlorothrix hollandica]|uniref:Shikimate dehydrogenase (NADP(+)) n=1 Tax=Prochlorothrix hollandica PCC 9006 = CALU 1027 TaxID=317619 RepID=A0A0M2PXX7_PROHO|nr:shikimate dehydrogenase [Prochlorothrix hollandica]KKI99523.1 shikimate dehydrogenase [Prochlorothrix hollandica PCC 9006 = CALU 1027]